MSNFAKSCKKGIPFPRLLGRSRNQSAENTRKGGDFCEKDGDHNKKERGISSTPHGNPFILHKTRTRQEPKVHGG